jgi:hypothetical protein
MYRMEKVVSYIQLKMQQFWQAYGSPPLAK